jgi:protein-S-isoprenylcysteine O-methyltransferase Ste14
MLFLIIFLAIIGLGIIVALHLLSSPFPYKIYFTILILAISIEIIWENFFSTKEKKVLKFEGDWTLIPVYSSFLVLMYVAVFEFYLFRGPLRIPVSLMGFLIYLMGLSLRLRGIRSLGKQWKVHIMGKDKLRLPTCFLIREGPYKYMRHPMYLGAFAEAIGIPLLLNAYYALGFGLLVFIPLETWRTYMEEKELIQTFGWKYMKYKREKWAFWFFKKRYRPKFYERRLSQLPINFEDRRTYNRRVANIDFDYPESRKVIKRGV